MATASFILLLFVVVLVECTVDLNIHQLQMVADHLSMTECMSLANALHQKNFDLETKTVSIKDTDNKPCIALLLDWDRTDGEGKSFDDLAFRLGQIGRKDLSEKLSRSVYGEKADSLDKLFLSDPFKKNVPKDSLLLDVKKKKDKKSEEENGNLTTWEIISIVSGSIIVACIIFYLIYRIFGTAIAKVFRKYAPEFFVKWFDMVTSELSWLRKKTKKRFDKEVIGKQREDARPRKKSVKEMNRSLNCYLNDNSMDALYYFDQMMRNI